MAIHPSREAMMIASAIELVMPGMTVNVGFGWPLRLMPALMQIADVMVHAENGVLGIGPPLERNDPRYSVDLINPAGTCASLMPGASYMDSVNSFALIRRGKLDVAFLGALQVSQMGDLASWSVPGKRISGMGGAKELAYGAKHVVVMMEQMTADGIDKLVESCSYPLTAAGVVRTLITDRGIYCRQTESRFVLVRRFEEEGTSR
jgi:3-oxoacid CoA-transferase B subunit